jgi:hypothetical protein
MIKILAFVACALWSKHDANRHSAQDENAGRSATALTPRSAEFEQN